MKRESFLKWLIVAAVVALALTPMFIHQTLVSISSALPGFVKPLPWLLLPAALLLAFRGIEAPSRRHRLFIVATLAALSLTMFETHNTLVDSPTARTRYFTAKSNADWNQDLHYRILERDLSQDSIPHIYRFLPNSVTELLSLSMGVNEAGRGDYNQGRILYRMLFQFLLTLSIYHWSRLHLSSLWALLPCALYAAAYPLSIVHYAGQLTDPMSHLSFVLGFLFLETRKFSCLLVTILLGIMAKESVFALALFYPLYELTNRDRRLAVTLLRSAVLVGLGLGLIWFIRHVMVDSLTYDKISGVTLDHLNRNVVNLAWIWTRLLLFFVGVWAPLAILGWRDAPRLHRGLILFLLPMLLVSGAFFSYLHESRNFMPLVIVMQAVGSIGIFKLADLATSQTNANPTPDRF